MWLLAVNNTDVNKFNTLSTNYIIYSQYNENKLR